MLREGRVSFLSLPWMLLTFDSRSNRPLYRAHINILNIRNKSIYIYIDIDIDIDRDIDIDIDIYRDIYIDIDIDIDIYILKLSKP